MAKLIKRLLTEQISAGDLQVEITRDAEGAISNVDAYVERDGMEKVFVSVEPDLIERIAAIVAESRRTGGAGSKYDDRHVCEVHGYYEVQREGLAPYQCARCWEAERCKKTDFCTLRDGHACPCNDSRQVAAKKAEA